MLKGSTAIGSGSCNSSIALQILIVFGFFIGNQAVLRGCIPNSDFDFGICLNPYSRRLSVAAVWFGLKDQRRYVGQTTHGGSDLLEGLGNSIQGFESLTDAELLKDVTSEKRKKVERERVKAKNSWKALEPLVTHELLSIVNATRDLPIYSPPEGEAAADPLIGEWIQKWQRDGDLAVITENGLNTRNDSAWHKEIVARLK